MKKKFRLLVSFLFVASIFILGCKSEIQDDSVAPADVTELVITASNGSVVLNWKNPTDPDFAGVQIAMSPAEGTLKNAVILGKDVISFDVSGITVGKEYTFTVKAFDESLNYSEGAEATATVADTADYTAPAEVTELTVQAANGNAVLNWKNPADTDFAGVQIAMSPAEGTLKNAVVLGKEVVSFDVSGITIGKEYTFTVKAFDESLNYSEGVEAKVTVADTSDKTAPADVAELIATNKDASVLLTWTDATDEDIYGYEVTWNKNVPINRSAAMEANSMMVAPGANGCYISNLTNGTEYAFTVKSVDTSGNKSTGVTKTITPEIIEKSPLQIALEQNTTERTNQDVVITVNATTDAASKIKKIFYVEGTESKIDTVLAGIDITESKEITATENDATFTVAVTDTAGRRELAFITVDNIDKTAPSQVGNFSAGYSCIAKQISLSWINPVQSDYDGTIISYYKTGSQDINTIECPKDASSYVIENIEADDSEYTIDIATKDDIGNIGKAYTVKLQAVQTVKIENISLDRTHLDTIMENRDIKVTISGSNFDLITSLWVQVFDGSSSVELNKNVSIDLEKNTATATIKAPVPTTLTDEGTIYTVNVIVDGLPAIDAEANFVVSKPACVTFIELSQSQLQVGSEEKITATIKGFNFDIPSEIKVKLFDSKDIEYVQSTVTVPFDEDFNATEFSVDIPVPDVDGIYRVVVSFDDINDYSATILQIYDSPIIESITIPTAGISYGGNKVPVTIIGKNFTAPGVESGSFTGNGAGITNFVIKSDTKVIAEVICPYISGTTEVTVTCGETSKTVDFKVIETEKCFEIGDIILTDGTKVSVKDVETYTIDENNKPIGVIGALAYGGGVGKIVGLQKSDVALEWAKYGTFGFETVFEEIVCSVNNCDDPFQINASTVTFTGDLDGSDNWDEICKVDPNGTQDAENNYPAFNFANNYGTDVLVGTAYETGWYLPSIAELCEVYKNKDVIQTSLTIANGFIFDDNGSRYWSSSQSTDYNFYVYQVGFLYGSVNVSGYKSNVDHVFVLHALNAE